MAHCLLPYPLDPNVSCRDIGRGFYIQLAAEGRSLFYLETRPMTRITNFKNKYEQWRDGKAGYALLWLLGIPLPILFAVYFLRGCN